MTVTMKKTAQVGCKVEGTEGAEESLTATEFSRYRTDTTRTQTRGEHERELEDGTYTAKPMLIGARSGRIEYGEEMLGKESGVPWWDTIQGMGFNAATVKMVELGSLTGTAFRTGQTIGDNASFGSATATGYVVHYEPGSPNKLWYVPLTGTFADTDIAYNYESVQGSADVDSTPADKGFRYRPATVRDGQDTQSCTVERRIGGYKHTIVGARASGSMRMALGEPPMLRAQFMGLPVFDSNGKPRAGAVVAGVPTLAAAFAVKAIPLVLEVGGTAKTVVFSEIDVEIDNQLAERPDVTSNALVSSGYQPPKIGGRRISVRVAPEHAPAEFDAVEIANNATTIRLIVPIGTVGGNHGLIVAHAPSLQIQGDLAPGDRDGIETDELTLLATGVDDDEFEVAHVWE